MSHLVVVALAVLFVNLGLWQLSRHDERADRNADITARSEQSPVPVEELLGAVADGADPADLRYRPVTLTGVYEEPSLLIDNRSRDGLPGAWVLTPLRLADGTTVAVSRGFLAPDGGDYDVPPAADVEVMVAGTVVDWDGDCGERRDGAGVIVGMACLDRDAVAEAHGGPVAQFAVQRVSSTPSDAAVLTPVPLPELDAGPHRSYAAQWFIFTAIGLIGYPLILRRVARDRAAGGGDDLADRDGDATGS